MSSFSDKLYRTKVAPLLVIGFLYCSCFLPSVFADGASTLSDEGPNHSGNLRASRGLQTAGLVSESESGDEKGLEDLLEDLRKVYYEQNMESDLVSETNYAAVEKKDLSVKGDVVEALEEALENMGEEYDEDLEDLIPEVKHAKVETFEDNLKEMGKAYEEDLEDLVPERNYAAVQTLKEDLEDMRVVAENELEDLVPKTNYAAEETLEKNFEDLTEKYEKELEDLVPETNYAAVQSESTSYTMSSSTTEGGDGSGISKVTTTRVVNGLGQTDDETVIQKPDGTVEKKGETLTEKPDGTVETVIHNPDGTVDRKIDTEGDPNAIEQSAMSRLQEDSVPRTNYAAVETEEKDLEDMDKDFEKDLEALEDLGKVYEQDMDGDLVSKTNYAAVPETKYPAVPETNYAAVPKTKYAAVQTLEEALKDMGEEYEEDVEDLIPETNHAAIQTFEKNLEDMGKEFEEDLEDLVPERNYAAVDTLEEDLENLGQKAEEELENLVPETNNAAVETLEEDLEDLAEKYEEELEDLVPETNYAAGETIEKDMDELQSEDSEDFVFETNYVLANTYCGCDACDDSVWNTDAGGQSCGDRINYLQMPQGGSLNQQAACSQIGGKDFPNECGSCNPETCGSTARVDPHTYDSNVDKCGCESCNSTVLNTDAGGHTCGERIDYLQRPEGGSLNTTYACFKIGAQDYPNECAGCNCTGTY